MGTTIVTLIKQVSEELVINRDCRYALEVGLELKDKNPDIKLIVCSMGHLSSKKSLRKALEVGYDEAYLLSDRRLIGSDTFATSYALSKLIEYLGFTDKRDDFIILTGHKTSDGDTAHIPSQVAENLKIAQASYVDAVLLNKKDITARKVIEYGYQILKLELPSLLSIIPTAVPLRRASLINTVRAKDKQITILNIDDIGVDSNRVGFRGSPTAVSKVETVIDLKESTIMSNGDNLIELVNSLIVNIKFKGSKDKKIEEKLRVEEREENEDLEDFKILDLRGGAKDILIWAEVVNGKVSKASIEILNPARYLAKRLQEDTKVKAVLIGKDISHLADELIKYGCDEVIVIDDNRLKEYQIVPFSSIFEQIIKYKKPEIILFPASVAGRELAPRVGIKVKGGMSADCIKLDIKRHISKTSKKIYYPLLEVIRPTHKNSKLANVIGFQTPQIASVRVGVFQVPNKDINREGKIEKFNPILTENDFRTKIVETIRSKNGIEELLDADIVIGGGRGAREDELKLIKELAKALKAQGVKASWAVTRAVADEKLAPYDRQIGETGWRVKPKVYIAVGISGAIQHMSVVKDSGMIVAINKKASEPIFKYADFGVVGEYRDILPLLINKVNNGFTFGVEVEKQDG